MKEQIEKLSSLKIRRGFEKFIEKTLSFYNYKLDSLTCETAREIVEFINKSNSKLHKAYWILRTDLTEEEYSRQIKEYSLSFVESSYKHSNRVQVRKVFLDNNFSYGYSGYEEINGKKFYCRSQCEFIVLHYLHSFYKLWDVDYSIEYEHSIFKINDTYSYKPDFFVFFKNKLTKIIEVKDSKEFLNSETHKLVKTYFENLKIEYEVIYNIPQILKLYPDIKVKVDKWKKNQATIYKDMRGENNPRFGIKLSDSGKKIVSDKAKERCKDPKYTQNLAEKNSKFQCYKKLKNFKKGIVRTRQTETGTRYYIVNEKEEVLYPEYLKDENNKNNKTNS